MVIKTRLLLTASLVALMLTAPATSRAEWRGGGFRGGFHGFVGPRFGFAPRFGFRGCCFGPGPFIGGAVLGLGLGAVVGSYYAPPVYYPPPVYYYPPPYYPPPPGYYPQGYTAPAYAPPTKLAPVR